MEIAVIGLGSMGLGMACSLLRAGFSVTGCDPVAAQGERLAGEGGRVAATPAQACAGADLAVLAVINAAQTEAVLFGEEGALTALAEGGVVISCATMAPEAARRLAERTAAAGCHYLDAPMSGGAARAGSGELTFLVSGGGAGLDKARPALEAMSARIYELGEEPGTGAAFKMINQLLAGVHIAAACEAMAFAARQGLDLAQVYEVISNSAGNSWMFGNRVPHILAGDYTPLSAVDIFVKDLGIVQEMAQSARFPVPVSAAALQMFLATSGAGMGRDDDASLARLYAQIAGVELPEAMP
ncbi:NAD(P)-dependent oxidoreductase [Starkeya koreensis]|uniref:L-threonate dehydrogenase n=1 Tax=Ancylobacter koreensis TaxID=266121 RepID=A0ABT0DJH6_9HYPH|nr:L-threonate dehydrogenase [Ancylobacter koreensis]MCK0207431.1 NAD(P)-dependent oxidoreductase [Ancylobacter koreensis]